MRLLHLAFALVPLAACKSTEADVQLYDVARATLDAGQPRDALVLLDELVEQRPRDARAWMLRAEACLATARDDTQAQFYYADALHDFELARSHGAGAEALFGAARAARLNLEPARALGLARAALVETPQPSSEQLRIAVEAAFDAYLERKQQAADPAALCAETEALLERMLTDAPDDVWALTQLANLYQWDGRPEGAVEVLAHALSVTPDDEALHGRFATLLRETEGRDSVVAFYESFRARHPASALAPWYEALELFELALELLGAHDDAAEHFRAAEQLFATCRAAKPDAAQNCLGYEVICRAGLGWSAFNAGDDAGAERAFLSMEELFAGGIEWRLEGRVLSGVDGLAYLADRAWRAGGGEGDWQAASKAARLFEKLHALRPDDAGFANNCGFLHREWGVPLSLVARAGLAAATSAAAGATTQDEFTVGGAALEQAQAQAETARAALRISRAAYLDAARLSWDSDVRTVNDAALILVYHFPSQADEAERMLLHAAELGARLKDDPALDGEARDLLLEAWGDVYQNLGVLELVRRRDPEKARAFFQRSIDIGPRPRIDRAWCQDVALPTCDAVAAGGALDPEALDPRLWDVE